MAKLPVDCPYKVICEVSIAAKIYDIKWPHIVERKLLHTESGLKFTAALHSMAFLFSVLRLLSV